MRFSLSTSLLVTTLALAPLAGIAQGNAKVASATASVKPATVARGGKGMLEITISVSPQYHINAHKPNDPDLIPTTFTPAASAGIAFGAARYPAARSIKVSYEKLPMLVYEGRAKVLIPFTVAKTAKPGRISLQGTLDYQGCNATSCYPPASAPVKAIVTIK